MDCETKCVVCVTGTGVLWTIRNDGQQILCDNDLCDRRTSVYYGDGKQGKAWNEWHRLPAPSPEASLPPVGQAMNDSGYTIFSSEDLVELIERVNKALVEGWVCCGGFSASTRGFYQAMIRQ